MPTDTDRQVTREFQRRLADIVHVLDLLVFGSRARGDAAPDSDMDVFIELDACTPALRQRIGEIAWKVGSDHPHRTGAWPDGSQPTCLERRTRGGTTMTWKKGL